MPVHYIEEVLKLLLGRTAKECTQGTTDAAPPPKDVRLSVLSRHRLMRDHLRSGREHEIREAAGAIGDRIL